MTATEALAHPWLAQLAPTASATAQAQRPDLLPSLRKNFNAKGTWKRAIMGVRAAGALKAGGEARRATLLAEATGTEEERQRVFEQAQRAKQEAEEEAVRIRSFARARAVALTQTVRRTKLSRRLSSPTDYASPFKDPCFPVPRVLLSAMTTDILSPYERLSGRRRRCERVTFAETCLHACLLVSWSCRALQTSESIVRSIHAARTTSPETQSPFASSSSPHFRLRTTSCVPSCFLLFSSDTSDYASC